jgi:hypothetical protein
MRKRDDRKNDTRRTFDKNGIYKSTTFDIELR